MCGCGRWASPTRGPCPAARARTWTGWPGSANRASLRGTEEAVLITPSGVVLEAAHSSVVWWEEDTVCLPSPHPPLLAGVTVALIQERAARISAAICALSKASAASAWTPSGTCPSCTGVTASVASAARSRSAKNGVSRQVSSA
jgi:hypothetical protein